MNEIHDGRAEFTRCPDLAYLKSHNSFTYRGEGQRVTMTKEVRRGQRNYWIAYAKINGRKVSKYVGVSEKVAKALGSLPMELVKLANSFKKPSISRGSC